MKRLLSILLLIILIVFIIYYNFITSNKELKEEMSNLFLHSGPNSTHQENHNKIDCLTKVNYQNRKSVTGKFIDSGPEYSKESYNSQIKTCNCPPFIGPQKKNVKTLANFQQVYPKRLSPTAMFIDDGPLPNNEYDYDNFINGCDCPKCGAV